MVATTIQEWREKNQPQEVELPSGNTALLRKVNLLELAIAGSIPTTLIVRAQDIKAGKEDWGNVMSDPDRLAEISSLIAPVVLAAFVEPAVAKEPDAEHLGIEEISMQDRMAVFQWCNADAEAVQPFRGDAEDGVEPVQDRGGDGDEAE
jgi:hypothetical protein